MKVKKFITTVILVIMVACGQQESDDISTRNTTRDNVNDLKKQILELQGQLQSLVNSDYRSCNGAVTGVVQNICKIAQAATEETRVEMKGAISDLSSQLESRINDSQTDVSTLTVAWKKIYGVDFPATTGAATPTLADCTANNSVASMIQCMIVQGNAVAAMQTTVNALNAAVSGGMVTVMIGSENIGSGPVYEEELRKGDYSQFNAYVDGLGAVMTVGSNPLASSNGSSIVTATVTAHGLAVNDRIDLQQCNSGAGFNAQNLFGRFLVASVPTANTFAFSLNKNASSSGNFGGSTCIFRKYSGSGLTTIWTNASGSDVAVRTTTGGSRSYNWAVCKATSTNGYACYDKTNASATFGTISGIAGWATTCLSVGNIVCK